MWDNRADLLLRVDFHGAAMEQRQRAGDGEAEARAALAFGILALHLFEGLTDFLQRGLRNTDAGIGDCQCHGVADFACPKRNLPAFVGEFHRI